MFVGLLLGIDLRIDLPAAFTGDRSQSFLGFVTQLGDAIRVTVGSSGDYSGEDSPYSALLSPSTNDIIDNHAVSLWSSSFPISVSPNPNSHLDKQKT